MTLTRSAAALAFGVGLILAAGPSALAAGAGCPQRADQEQAPGPTYQAQKTQGLPPSVQDRAQRADQEQASGPTYQAQKTQGLPPSVQDRAQRADQEQLGQNTGQAQQASQEQSGTQVASNCR